MILAVIADDKISLLYAKNKECKHMKTSVETNSRLIQVVTTVHHKILLLATSISLFPWLWLPVAMAAVIMPIIETRVP